MKRNACLFFLLFLAACGGGGESAPRLNVVLVSIDTLRADHLGCYGYERETSPRIDRLAQGGVLFEQHVSNTSWTLPSHATLLTGLPETVHEVENDDRILDPARTTLAETLRASGYRTGGFFSGPYLHPAYGFGQGFETYESAIVLERPPERRPVWEQYNEADRMRLIERYSYQVSTGPEVIRRATAWLDSLSGEQPFFLFVHLFDCHWDYVPPEPYWRKFDPDFDDPTFDGRMFFLDERIRPDMPERLLEHVVARYDGEILFTDEMVGRLLDRLEELGLDQDTLVVVTSDHGEEFFDHGQKGHRNNVFDVSLHVPLILHLPGRLPAGRHVERQTAIVDVAPTILDLVGVAAHPEVLGRSLLPLLGAAPPGALMDRPATGRLLPSATAPLHLRFCRTAGWKLIASGMGDGPGGPEHLAFFDLSSDPDERNPIEATSGSGSFPDARLESAYRLLVAQENREREIAASLRFEKRAARPDIDAELKRQLIETGYLGGGD